MILDRLNKKLVEVVKNKAAEKSVEISEEILNQIYFEINDEESHGDYSTSCALKLAKTFSMNPREVAESLVEHLTLPSIKSLAVEGAGFINVYLTSNEKSLLLKEIVKLDSEWGKNEKNKGKILIEFVSSNPTGPLHVGHGRGAVLGMALSNLLENSGYKVTKEYYVNDAGRQISILISSILVKAYIKNFNIDGMYEGSYIHELAQEFSKDHGKVDIALKSEELSDDKEKALDQISEYFQTNHANEWEAAKNFSVANILDTIKQELHSFDIVHDNWFHESSLGSIQDSDSDLSKSLSAIEKAGHTFSRDDAIWFRTTEFKDDKDRVLLRENGEPTYYLTDVGYHKNKIDRDYDLCINIFGADHHGYITRLTAAFDVMKSKEQEIEFMLYQLVNLYEDGNKRAMSTRKGEFYSLEELRKELGPDVIKFFFLEKKSDHPMDFDINLAKDESKNNPYFYSQYAHVRCCSILTKKNFDPDIQVDDKEIEKNFDIVNKLLNFPHFLERYTDERSPHSLVHYVKDLSAAFHTFYEQNPVINDEEKIENSRLLLTLATRVVLANSFRILNVKPLEKM
tara:strand:- start:5097 stop:6806 length:1710 start_codon:yes stop_codon:yes gene_type:complete